MKTKGDRETSIYIASISLFSSNIAFFENTGLDRNYTFTGLNLVAKTNPYYCTVRATSKALSFTSVTSTELYAGYREDMDAGAILVRECWHSNTTLDVIWNRFDSDFPIIMYYIGLYDQNFTINPDLSCEDNLERAPSEPITEFVQLLGEMMYTFNDLNLIEGENYYVVIYAYNLAGHCAINISSAITVDMTPPIEGNLTVGVNHNGAGFLPSHINIHVSWDGYEDPETRIDLYMSSLYRAASCKNLTYSLVKDWVELYTEDTDERFIDYEGLELEFGVPYYVVLLAHNCALNVTETWTPPLFIDTTAPVDGVVKDGESYDVEESYSPNTTDVFATLTMVHSPQDLFCATTRNISFEGEFPEQWQVTDSVEKLTRKTQQVYQTFTKEMVEESDDGLILHVKQNMGKKYMQGVDIAGDREELYEGKFSAFLQAVPGHNILTSFDIVSSAQPDMFLQWPIPDNAPNLDNTAVFTEEVDEDGNIVGEEEEEEREEETEEELGEEEEEEGAENESDEEAEEEEEDEGEEDNVEEEAEAPFQFIDPNMTIYNLNEIGVGFGISLLGHRVFSQDKTANVSYCLFWVAVDGIKSFRFVQLSFDPTEEVHEYSIQVTRQQSGFVFMYDLTLIIDGVPLEGLSQLDLAFRSRYTPYISVWMNNEYYPPPPDDFTPFTAQGLLVKIIKPIPKDQLCHFGEPFYDFESGISEIWVGLGTNKTGFTDDIVPYHKYQDICLRCNDLICDDIIQCDPNCTDTDIRELLEIHFTDLDLSEGDLVETYNSEGDLEEIWQPSEYFVVVKVVNRAGLYSEVKSTGIIIDTTAPEHNLTDCMDPWFSMSSPALEQASNISMGAVFSFDDDQSSISYYEVAPAILNEETQQLQLIANYTKIPADYESFIIEGLSLEQDQNYHYVVVATNGAHLTTTSSCNITVSSYSSSHTQFLHKFSGSLHINNSELLCSGKYDTSLPWYN